jgi:P27 family predicted phage terminase small subunit
VTALGSESFGLLALIDFGTVQDAAVCWARILQCERDLSTKGLVQDTKDRGRTKNPHATIAKQYRDQFKFYVAELGLGPSARGRLEIPIGGYRPEPGPRAAGAELLD